MLNLPMWMIPLLYQIRVNSRRLSIGGPPMKTGRRLDEFRMVLEPIAAFALHGLELVKTPCINRRFPDRGQDRLVLGRVFGL